MVFIKVKLVEYAVRTKDALCNNILWLYSLGSLFLKQIALLGFTINITHQIVALRSAIKQSFDFWPFYFAFIIFFLSFGFLMKGRTRSFYVVFTNLFFSFIFMVDLWYFRGFETMPSLQILNQTSNLNNMSEGILSVMHLIDVLFIIDVFVLIILLFGWKSLPRDSCRRLVLFAVTFVVSVGTLYFIPSKVEIFDRNWKGPTAINHKLSPIGFHIYSVYLLWEDSKPVNLTVDETDEIKVWFEAKVEKLPDNKYKGMLKGKNLLHIDIESMESFIINQKIDGQEITPNINKLLKSSLYFEVHEQVNQGNSSDADLLVNTSIYPLRQSSTFFAYPNTTYNSMPKLLEKLGYSTMALHPDEGSFWNWMPALTAMGFQKCIGAESWIRDEEFFLGITDRTYFRQAEPVIAKLKQPFYAFMPTQSSHSPFDIPESYRYLKLPSELQNTTLGLYFQAQHYADKCVGEMISYLERDGLLDNTVVVLAGDHAGITKYHIGEAEKVKPSQDWWLVKDKKVPFVIYNKDISPEAFDIIGGQIDILPTLAYLMGIDDKEVVYSAMGRNLLKTNKSFAVLANGEYVGTSSNEKERQAAINGLGIADKIIKSNYFEKNFNNSQK